jgi:hypothetical protein
MDIHSPADAPGFSFVGCLRLARADQSVMSAGESAAGGEAENICSVRALPLMTRSGPLG